MINLAIPIAVWLLDFGFEIEKKLAIGIFAISS